MQAKIIFIGVLILITATPCTKAQKQVPDGDQVAFKTIHVFNLRPKFSSDDMQVILEKFNSLFIRLGHPDCQYMVWENVEKKNQTRYLWESYWSSKRVYDEIHENSEYRKLIREDFIGLRKMFKDHTYTQYFELPFN